jgi:transcriptional regulator with XRE-family HTH domain
MALESLRKCDEIAQVDFARKLGISKAHLCDLEKGRRFASPGRAAKFAKALGHPPEYFVKLALQDLMRADGLKLSVEVYAA